MNKLLIDSCKNLSNLLISNVDKDCIICRESNNDGILLFPCNHYQLCKRCFSYLNDKKCPICRKNIHFYLEFNKNLGLKNVDDTPVNSFENSSDDEYENEYNRFNYENRSIPFQERVILRRMGLTNLSSRNQNLSRNPILSPRNRILATRNNLSPRNNNLSPRNRVGRFPTWW